MAIILLPKGHKGPAKKFSRHWLLGAALLAVVVVPVLSVFVGYYAGVGATVKRADLVTDSLRYDLLQQRQEVAQAKQAAQENLTALTLRLAELQSRSIRLDALGQRLTEMADLDKGEFDFENPPAQGGPADPTASYDAPPVDEFLTSFDALTQQMDDREQQLAVLESFLMTRSLEGEVFPAGFPAEKGWISSFFGKRTDPFTGRPAQHDGIDIAAKEGTGILAVAAGVVTWSSNRYGYGQLVEINHGNGYVTRYAHNKQILVEVGDMVKKGQRVALMGSSGRSTGPHVHFEVLRNGLVVNPAKYVRAGK